MSRFDWLVWLVAATGAISVSFAVSASHQRLTDWREGAAPAGRQTTPDPPPASIETITALALFGQQAAPQASANVLETDLNLTLHGVVLAVPSPKSRAIISGDREPAHSYVVGDEITGGMRLIDVQGDHVILEFNGRGRTLSFPKRQAELPAPDGIAAQAGASGDIDALRALIFNQANSRPEEAK